MVYNTYSTNSICIQIWTSLSAACVRYYLCFCFIYINNSKDYGTKIVATLIWIEKMSFYIVECLPHCPNCKIYIIYNNYCYYCFVIINCYCVSGYYTIFILNMTEEYITGIDEKYLKWQYNSWCDTHRIYVTLNPIQNYTYNNCIHLNIIMKYLF